MIFYSMTPSYFVILLKRNLLQISSILKVIIGYIGFTKFGVIGLYIIYFIQIGVLEILWNCQNPLLLFIGSNWTLRACSLRFYTWLEVSVHVSVFILFSCGSRPFYFLVDPLPFIFLLCFVYSDTSELESCCKGLGVWSLFSLDLSNFYWCGHGRSHMDR